MIVNVRGTSGSGKSTVVRKIMSLAPSMDKIFQKTGRKNPLFYRLKFDGGSKVVSVPGHYETACGGCDTIKTYDQLFEIIRFERASGNHVLFEGLLVAHDRKRCAELWEHLERRDFAIIELMEPIDVCVASVEKRRHDRDPDNTKPFNPDNTVRRFKEVARSCQQLEELGIKVYREDRAGAARRAAELLGLDWQSAGL